MLEDGLEVGDAVVKDLGVAQPGGEGACADVAVVIAGVGDDDFDVGAVDEEAVGGATGGLIEASEGLIDGQSGEEGVLADEVPVAHPWSAEVADGAVVGEG